MNKDLIQDLKQDIFDCVIFVQDTCPDNTTLVNILKAYDGKPKKLSTDVVKPTLLHEVLTVLELKRNSEHKKFVSDQELDSVIMGELYEYMNDIYLKLYLEANENLIVKYLENWKTTKTFIENNLKQFKKG